MINIVSGPEHLPWAAERVGVGAFHSDAKTLALTSDGVVRAVAVYDRFSECDCNMHIASDGTGRWLTRAYLCEGFAYPFVQLGLRRVTGLVPTRNKRALAFNAHVGFEGEGLLRRALPDDDIIVLGMLRERCRFIHPRFRLP